MDTNTKEYFKHLIMKAQDSTDQITDGTSLAQRYYFHNEHIIGTKAVIIPLTILDKFIKQSSDSIK